MTTFIDTNVVIAMLDPSHVHHQWSTQEFNVRKAQGPVILSDIVYCEVSVAMPTRADMDAAIQQFAFERFSLDDDALFRAGQAFSHYKNTNAGPKLGVMPDFLIGAAAEVNAAPLMTANARDFAGYFNLQLITPPLASATTASLSSPATQP